MLVLVVWNTTATSNQKMSSNSVCEQHDGHVARYISMVRHFITRKETNKLKEIIKEIKKHKCMRRVFQDENGVEQETPIQLAAKFNMLTLFDGALEDVFLDNKNSAGKRALHIAAECGNEDSIEVLLKHNACLSTSDNEGNTPFHSAARCGKLRPLLRQTMKLYVDIEEPLKLAISEYDNTLMIIVKQALNKMKQDEYVEEEKRQKLRITEVRKLINERNNNGDSPLDLAAKFGDMESVEELLEAKVDLIASVLIKIILQSLKCLDNQEKLDILKQIYRVIVKHANKGKDGKYYSIQIATDPENPMSVNFPVNYRMRDLLECKIQHSFEEEKHIDGIRISSAVKMKILDIHCNMRHFNILQFACAIGADEMVKEILITPGVYMFVNDQCPNIVYDVTNFSPETLTIAEDNRHNFRVNAKAEEAKFKPLKESDKTINISDVKSSEESNKREIVLNIDSLRLVDDRRSCLEVITYYGKSNKYRSWNILQISPFKELAEKYWKVERIVYVLLVFHIIFMACFTNYNLPTNDSLIKRFNINSTSHTSMPTTPTPPSQAVNYSGEGCWLIWPVCLVIIEMATQLESARYVCNEETYKSNSVSTLFKKWHLMARPEIGRAHV